ncbi:hypothetical protein M9H77_29605 [Catharanthus roseus]|uniref:Uncharacterized protein n=1 Tax=Catharanthus roseus TaxID=4058 RepID=A0ACB9ZZ44_CATRO|nr:hypothetical protein M9H77_29605 [Catharanthus roseus]
MNSKKYGVIIIKELRTLDKMQILILIKSYFKRHDALTWKIEFDFLEIKFYSLQRELHHYLPQSNDKVSSIMEEDLDIGNRNDFGVNVKKDMDEQESDPKTPSDYNM